MKMFKVEFLQIKKADLKRQHPGHFDTHVRCVAYIEAESADQASAMFRKEQPDDRVISVVAAP